MRHSLTILLLILWFTAHAQQTGTKLTITIPGTSLEAALKLLERESRIPVSYELTRVKDIRVKAHIYKDIPLEIILRDMLDGTPLDFKLKAGNILITPRPRTVKTLSGFVEDAVSGEKLIGVSLSTYPT